MFDDRSSTSFENPFDNVVIFVHKYNKMGDIAFIDMNRFFHTPNNSTNPTVGSFQPLAGTTADSVYATGASSQTLVTTFNTYMGYIKDIDQNIRNAVKYDSGRRVALDYVNTEYTKELNVNTQRQDDLASVQRSADRIKRMNQGLAYTAASTFIVLGAVSIVRAFF